MYELSVGLKLYSLSNMLHAIFHFICFKLRDTNHETCTTPPLATHLQTTLNQRNFLGFRATTINLIAIIHNVVMATGIVPSAVDSVFMENAVSQIVSCAISAITHDL
jgi:hypothetical protein